MCPKGCAVVLGVGGDALFWAFALGGVVSSSGGPRSVVGAGGAVGCGIWFVAGSRAWPLVVPVARGSGASGKPDVDGG